MALKEIRTCNPTRKHASVNACFLSETPLTVEAMTPSPCPSPRHCLGTVIVLAMPLTSTLSWYCHRPRHDPHLNFVLALSSPSPCPSPRLCLGTVIALAMPLTSSLSWYCHHPRHAPHLDFVLVLSSPPIIPHQHLSGSPCLIPCPTRHSHMLWNMFVVFAKRKFKESFAHKALVAINSKFNNLMNSQQSICL